MQFIKDKPDVTFLKADKGNTTVAIKRSEYIERMLNLLSDQ